MTLSPEAEKGGATYAGILAKARQKIKLADLGIEAVKLRQATTGARILEVPGRDSSARADQLAEKLRAALAEKGVKVARPIKCAEICLTGPRRWPKPSRSREPAPRVILRWELSVPDPVALGPSGQGAR